MNPFSALKKLIQAKPLVDEIEKDVNTMTTANWKTNTAGIAALLIALAQMAAPAKWQPFIVQTMSVLTGLGLLVAKDHNK